MRSPFHEWNYGFDIEFLQSAAGRTKRVLSFKLLGRKGKAEDSGLPFYPVRSSVLRAQNHKKEHTLEQAHSVLVAAYAHPPSRLYLTLEFVYRRWSFRIWIPGR